MVLQVPFYRKATSMTSSSGYVLKKKIEGVTRLRKGWMYMFYCSSNCICFFSTVYVDTPGISILNTTFTNYLRSKSIRLHALPLLPSLLWKAWFYPHPPLAPSPHEEMESQNGIYLHFWRDLWPWDLCHGGPFLRTLLPSVSPGIVPSWNISL